MLKIAKFQNAQIITTNRFLNKNSLEDWSTWRMLLTNLRHIIIKLLLNIQFDSSGAFRLYKTREIQINDILLAKNESYSFFWESIFILHKKNYKIHDIPVNLPSRRLGSSKMKMKDILGALFYLFFYSIKRIFYSYA